MWNNKRNYTITAYAGAIAETGWQYGAQYLDKRYANTWVGIPDYKIAGSDLTAILYPVFFGLLAWQAAAYFWDGKDEDEKNKEGKKIGRNICLAMAGWTLGYYAADFLGFGKWGTASAVGAGIALPGLVMSSYDYFVNGSKTNNKTSIGVTGAAIFAAGFLWYVDYLLPAFIGGDKTTHEIMKSVVSPAATLITTAFCVVFAMKAQKQLVQPEKRTDSSCYNNIGNAGGSLGKDHRKFGSNTSNKSSTS